MSGLESIGILTYNRLIAVDLPQPRRQAQEPLHALEFVEPILRNLREQRIPGNDDACRAHGASLVAHHLAILAQGALAIAGNLGAVLTEENDDRNAIAGVDLQLATP